MFFFFNDTATTEIYTLSLHDALPISPLRPLDLYGDSAPSGLFTLLRIIVITAVSVITAPAALRSEGLLMSLWKGEDRKSTRLNSSHSQISYAVFCLKKEKTAILQPHS